MKPLLRPRDGEPLMLRTGGSVARVRPWPYEPDAAHLVFFSQHRLPPIGVLTGWLQQLHGIGYSTVRTGALNHAGQTLVEQASFVVIQKLVLLQHRTPGSQAAAIDRGVPLRRITEATLPVASAIDRAAFGPPWGFDPTAVADVLTATPRHRARFALTPDGDASGYAISGRDGRLGFLQRLAVHPDSQQQGLGAALVRDSLRWMSRRRVHRVLVNTHADNHAALALYAATGFDVLPDSLAVYERALP